MPERYSPIHTWHVDWKQDGKYDHQYSNLTPYINIFSLTYGASYEAHQTQVVFRPAFGNIGLAESGAFLDPTNDNPPMNADWLRRRNPCQLRVDGHTIWEGTIQHRGRTIISGEVRINFDLGSKYANKHRENIELNHNARTTVANFLSRATNETGIPIAFMSNQPIGVVQFDGVFSQLMNQLSVYACGYMIEQNDGSVAYRNYADSELITVSASLGTEYEPSANDFFYGEQPGHVRNKLLIRGSFWDTADPTPYSVGEKTIVIPSGESRLITYDFDAGSTSRPSTLVGYNIVLARRGNETLRADDIPEISYNLESRSDHSLTVRATSKEYDGDDIEFTIQVRSRVQTLQNTDERDIILQTEDTQDVYGEREVRIPPLFTSDFDGLYEYTLPFFYHLAKAPRYMKIKYRPRQLSKGRSEVITRAIRPGTRANFKIADPALGTQTLDCMVLGLQIRGGNNVETVYEYTGYEIFDPDIPSIHIQVNSVTTDEAMLEVGQLVTPDSNKEIWFRYRTTPRGAWQQFELDKDGNRVLDDNNNPIRIKKPAENRVNDLTLLGLSDTTEYEIQASYRSDFRDIEATTIFSTRETIPDSLRLKDVLLNGEEITVFSPEQSIATYNHTDYRENPTITITAEPEDDDTTVTVTPSTAVEVEDGQSYEWTILAVNSDGDELTYYLFISVTAVVLGDINTLSGAGNNDPRTFSVDPVRLNLWVWDNQDRKVYSYNASTGAHQPDRTFDVSLVYADALDSGISHFLIGENDFFLTRSQNGRGWRAINDKGQAFGIEQPPPSVYGANLLYTMQVLDERLYVYVRVAGQGRIGVLPWTLVNGVPNIGRSIRLAQFSGKGGSHTSTRGQMMAVEADDKIWTSSDGFIKVARFDLDSRGRYAINKDTEFSLETTLNRNANYMRLIGRRLLVLDSADDKIYVYNIDTGEYVGADT